MDILVIGGTGQTGPLIIQGLVDEGHNVTILHSGKHEPPLPPIEHLHADVHFAETITPALEGRKFDTAICMYGRAQVVADALRGRVGRLISISGTRYYYGRPDDPRWGPTGAWIASEESPFSDDPEIDRLGSRVYATEQAIMAHQAAGDYDVTIMRFPGIYGPDSILPADWGFVRRILDGRRSLLMPDGGLMLRSRAYRDNAAHAVLLAVKHAEAARGEIFNVSDDPPELSLGQTVMTMARALGHEIEFIDCPGWLGHRVYGGQIGFHRVLDSSKIRERLGYRDKVPLLQALADSACWWRDNAPERGGEVELKLGDAFDYEMEDRIIDHLLNSVRTLDELAANSAQSAHPFRHPKREGEAWNRDSSAKLMNSPFRYPYPLRGL
ncbi:MAG TPA: NAD-dependent epimerase/dehydratase family protein [Novosphingobium sp.]|nr:NAD-dependent epimerase/dehydratase family protein [Novosphingobium sp.]